MGLAVDWISNKLYWADKVLQRIEVLDLVEGYRMELISTGPDSEPCDMVVDPGSG